MTVLRNTVFYIKGVASRQCSYCEAIRPLDQFGEARTGRSVNLCDSCREAKRSKGPSDAKRAANRRWRQRQKEIKRLEKE